MVPRALLGARRVVFASANPLVSVTGNSSPAAALICVFTLPKLPATTYYTIGRCPVARPYTRLAAVPSGVAPSSAASPRTSACANRAGGPASPHLPSTPRAQLSTFFVLPQLLCSRSTSAASTAPLCRAHGTAPDPTRETGGSLSKKTNRSSRDFFSSLRLSTPLAVRRDFCSFCSSFNSSFFCSLSFQFHC